MAVTLAQLTSYFTNANAGSAPTAAQTAALTGIFNQNATSVLSDAAAYQAALDLGSDTTTAVSVQTYQYFLGFAPSQAGLAALNAAYVGAGSQAGFNGENRYIAQSVSLALQNPTAKAAFASKVGSLSFGDAATLVYNEIVGSTAAAAAGLNVSAAVAFLTSTSAIEYYTNFVKANAGLGANPSAADVNLAVKAALVGAIMNAATAFNGGAGVGSYAVAANNLVKDLADDGVLTANNAAGINLFASYGTTPVIPTPPVTYALSVDAPTVTEGNGGTKVITFTLSLGSAPSQAVTVNYQTLATGTAASGDDFVPVAGTVTFAAGQSVATVSVTVNGDTAVEADETVLVKFSGTSLQGEVTATGTINNDDVPVVVPPAPTYTLSVDAPTVTEGNSGTKVVTFTLNLGATPTEAVTVNYQTLTTGTATSGEDFVADAGTVTFAAGQSVATVSVTVNGDAAFEANETVLVKFTGTRLAGEVTATGTINNDDVNPATQPVNKALTVSATDVVEGAGGDDVFIGQVGTTTTLQASDKISGGAGADQLRVVTDAAATIQGFTVTGVETLEVQAQTGATVLGLENVDSALATIRSSSSNAALTVKNVGQLVGVEIVNALNSQDVTIAYKAAAVSNAADTQNIALNGNAIGTLKIGSNNDTLNDASGGNTGIETIAITATGSASSIGTLNSTASTVNVSGTQNLTIGALNGAVTKVGAAGFTGNLNATLVAPTAAITQADTVVTVESGAGSDVLNVSANTLKVNVNAGAGNDTINAGGNLTSTDTVAGGDGVDTLQVTTIAAVANATTNAAGETFKNVSGVETLAFTSVTSGTLNAASFATTTNTAGTGATNAGVTTYDFQNGINGLTTISGVSDNSTVSINSKQASQGVQGNSLTVSNATDGTADTLNLTVTTDLLDDQIGTITAKYETLNITATDTNVTELPTPSGTAVDVLTIGTLTDNDLKTLNIAGSAKVVVTGQITAGALTTVNASTNTGGVTLNIDDADDVSVATAQNVSVSTGAGADSITIGGANNFGAYTVNTGSGNDAVVVTSAAAANVTHTITTGNTATGGAGSVNVTGGGSNTKSVVTTGSGNWTINTAAGADAITSGAGNDTINSGNGNDTISAGAGNDTITVGVGVVSVDGGDGNDTFKFVGAELTSADSITGGAGTDILEVTTASTINDSAFNNWVGVETLTLAAGSSVTMNAIANAKSFTTVNLSTGTNTVNLAEGFTNALTVNLSTGNDTVNATTAPGAVTINANASSVGAGDFITGGTSAGDVLNLKADNSRADLVNLRAVETINATVGAAATDNLVVDLNSDAVIAANGTLTVSSANLTNTTAFITLDASDITTGTKKISFVGGAGADKVYGGAGADSINGAGGADVLFGGAGADVLTGGAGADQFTVSAVAQSASTAVDTITDFVSGTDKVVIETTLLGGKTLNFAGNQASFGAAQGATNQGDNVVDYVLQTDTNTLWIDINDDGTLNANDIQIKLTNITTLATGDVISGSVLTSSAVSFLGTVAQYNTAAPTLLVNDVVTVADTSANTTANLTALLADAKVDNIDSTQNAVAFNATVANITGAGNLAKLQEADSITVADTGAATAAALATLIAEAKVDIIDTTDDVLTIGATTATAKLVTGDTITASDTSAALQGNLVALLADNKVDVIDSTQDGTTLTLTVAQHQAAGNVTKLVTGDTVTVADTGALTAGVLAALIADGKVDIIDTTDNVLTIGATTATAKLVAGDTITASDASAALQGNLVALLADTKVDVIDSTQDGTTLTLTVAQQQVAANMNKLVTGDTVTVADASATIGGAIASLFADAKVDTIDSNQDATAFTITGAQALVAANVNKLVTGDTVSVSDTGANIVTNLSTLVAEAKFDVLDASDNLISLTAAQFTTLTGSATGVTIAANDVVRVTASTGADSFDLNDNNLGTSALQVVYTAVNQAKTTTYAEVGGNGFGNSDTFTFVSTPDVISNFAVATDKLDLSAFNVVQATAGATLTDGTYQIQRGTLTGAVFTLDAAGNDAMVIWDGNTTAAVTLVGTVISGGFNAQTFAAGNVI